MLVARSIIHIVKIALQQKKNKTSHFGQDKRKISSAGY